MQIAVIALIALGIPALWLMITYNSLVTVKNHCKEAWSNIDTELKRRHDLIPNLVDTVKGYAKHERELLEKITQLRQQCLAQDKPGKDRELSENELTGNIERLMARVENYPDLKASNNFLDLQKELINTEDRIQAALRFYNGNIRENNNKVQMFPSNIVANVFSFREMDFFEIKKPEIRETPEVKI